MIDKTAEQLQQPFNVEDIEWRVGHSNADKSQSLVLPYITNRAIMQRLDDVFGCMGWQNEFTEWKEKGQLCGISVYNGDSDTWVCKYDGADCTDIESTKGGLSDSMKRAAVQWGIGRYLYGLPPFWTATEVKGRTVVISKGFDPQLPAWALPSGSGVKPARGKAKALSVVPIAPKPEPAPGVKKATKGALLVRKMYSLGIVDRALCDEILAYMGLPDCITVAKLKDTDPNVFLANSFIEDEVRLKDCIKQCISTFNEEQNDKYNLITGAMKWLV